MQCDQRPSRQLSQRPSQQLSQRCQHGIVGAEVLPFVVLIFVGAMLMLAQGWAVLDAKIAATSGAREAARTFAEQRSTHSAGALRAAINAGERAIAGYRLSGEATVSPVDSARLRRCARVTFEAAVSVPQIGSMSRAWSPIEVRARSSEIVEPFRHGPRGQAPCTP